MNCEYSGLVVVVTGKGSWFVHPAETGTEEASSVTIERYVSPQLRTGLGSL
jgi:hypothetical protein